MNPRSATTVAGAIWVPKGDKRSMERSLSCSSPHWVDVFVV